MLREGLEIGARHHLFIGGCDAVALAEEYGTPLYVIDEMYLRGMCRAFTGALKAYTDGGICCYASKAYLATAICRIIEQEGMGLDVVSGGELFTARHANFPMARVTLHGNCKTPGELQMAVDLGIGHIVIDSLSEIRRIEETAAAADRTVSVLIRLNPAIAARTHRAIQTAVADCKFGLGIDDGQALAAVKMIAACSHLRLTGVHVHIGSQIFDIQPYLRAAARLTDFMLLASGVLGRELETLVLGGGFGVRYTDADPPTTDIRATVRDIARTVEAQAREKGMTVPQLVLEPGRIIIAEAGVALYTVSSVKDIPGVRTYVGIDGGMMDNPRVALYDAAYEALLAERADARPDGAYAIAGRACETGDVFGLEFSLPRPEVGEILAMPVAGAYQMAMASNYNRVPFAAVVLAKYGKSAPIFARQRYEDLVQYDRVPSWLG